MTTTSLSVALAALKSITASAERPWLTEDPAFGEGYDTAARGAADTAQEALDAIAALPVPATTGWPDPARPGFPIEPEVTRFHFLGVNGEHPRPERWVAGLQEWALPGGIGKPAEIHFTYHGPCYTQQELEIAREKRT